MGQEMEEKIENLINLYIDDYQGKKVIDQIKIFEHPDRAKVIDILEKLQKIIYPGYRRNSVFKTYTVRNSISVLLEDIIYNLKAQLSIVLKYAPQYQHADPEAITLAADSLTFRFLEQIPKIRAYIETDVQAAFDGDPAAYNTDEIICTYPGLYATLTNRIAHELYLLDVPMIPRIMTEHAHSIAGIDIHPGTTIGKYFFIDHGTGVVIGETTTIGREVKLYQHVTLGEKSFDAAPDGSLVKGIKRHPDIGDRVIIYSGATILGGDTRVGNDCVIGGSVWLTHSVPAGKLILAKAATTGNSLTRDILAESSLDSAML